MLYPIELWPQEISDYPLKIHLGTHSGNRKVDEITPFLESGAITGSRRVLIKRTCTGCGVGWGAALSMRRSFVPYFIISPGMYYSTKTGCKMHHFSWWVAMDGCLKERTRRFTQILLGHWLTAGFSTILWVSGIFSGSDDAPRFAYPPIEVWNY
jgi:hypothetical protein